NVVDADNCSGLEAGGQKGARRLAPAFEVIGIGGGADLERGEPGRGIHHRFHALVDRAEDRVVADEAEALMADAVKVVDHFIDDAAVIHTDVGDIASRRADIVEDYRNAATGELFDQGGLHFR